MRTIGRIANRFSLFMLIGLASYPLELSAQKTAGHDFIRWRLKTTGPAYLSFEDEETLYLTVNKRADDVSDQLVLAVSSKDGLPKWAYETERPYLSVSGRSGELLYIHAGGAAFSKNITVVLNASSGEGVWHIISADNQKQTELQQGVFLIQTGGTGELAAFMIQEGMFGTADRITNDDLRNKIVAMDYAKGEELWRIYLDTLGGPYNETQALDIEGSWAPFYTVGNMVFFSSSLYLAAADVTTGKTLWVNQTNKERWDEEDIKPIIEGRRIFFGGPDISCLDIVDGHTIWSYPLDTLFQSRLLIKSASVLLAEIKQSIDPLRSDSAIYSLLAIDLNTGKKIWHNHIDHNIVEINATGKSIQYKTEDNVILLDLNSGREKHQVDIKDFKFWLSPDATFILSGGEDSIVSLLFPDGSLIDTVHLGSTVKNVFALKNFPFLIIALQSGEILALGAPSKANTSYGTPVNSAEDLIINSKPLPLPPLHTIIPSNTAEIKTAEDRLRYKRYGFAYEYASVQQCNNGCSKETVRQSFGISYKRYYGRWWAIQPELFYMRRGGSGLKTNQIDAFEYDLRYLNLHILGEVGTPSDWRARLYLFGGPFYGYPVYSKYILTRSSGSVSEYPFNAQHDWGLIAGWGLDLAFKRFFLYAEYRGYFGLRPVVSGELPTPGATLAQGKNTASGITIGIGF
jgi:outer membrane protein assembly factor BamB